MDTDAYTCGQCKHGNFYGQCGKCEDDYERQRKAATTRQKLGEAWAPWMDKKPEQTSKPCELGPLPFNAPLIGALAHPHRADC